MNILIDIGHPGHVHLFRNAYFKLLKKGHNVFVTTRDIPIIISLLDYYNIPYINLGNKKDSLFGKALVVLRQIVSVYKIVRREKIDLGISSGIVFAHVSRMSKMISVMFDDDDDEMESLVVKYGHPFSDFVFSPSCIVRKSKNNIPYNGSHELTYLHPKYFTPDESILRKAGLKKGEKYFVLRFVALKGHHDIGHTGINIDQKRDLINVLKKYGKVFITAEREIEPEFEQYRIPVLPYEMHSFIYYATLFLGDSQTMTSEAAVLGTPALKCNTFAGKLSVPNELEYKYDLCYSFQPAEFDRFIKKTQQLLKTSNVKELWGAKRQKFLRDKIDVTSFMVWFIEKYPESSKILQENPKYQNEFK